MTCSGREAENKIQNKSLWISKGKYCCDILLPVQQPGGINKARPRVHLL